MSSDYHRFTVFQLLRAINSCNLFIFPAGQDVIHLAVPLFRLAALRGNVNAKYTYAQLLRTGGNYMHL